MAARPAESGGVGEPVAHRVFSAAAWPLVEPVWKTLFEASGSTSFFSSPAWVGAWLETFGAALGARVVVFEGHEGPVGVVVLVGHRGRWSKGALRRLHLHTAGESAADDVAVEYSDVLVRPGCAREVAVALAALLHTERWDELHLSGMTEAGLRHVADALPETVVETEWRPTYLVDLARLRDTGQPYEDALSRTTRRQIRRSLELYRARGDVQLHFARTVDEALEVFRELHVLHQARWTARGLPGAFASQRWRAFHERVLARALPRGTAELARVTVAGETLGVLYNFVQGGTTSFYQSGFRFEADNRLKPGLVTHALVIQDCLERGRETYDFLASGPAGARYKRSLATRTDWLAWSVVRRASRRMRLYLALRWMKRLAASRQP